MRFSFTNFALKLALLVITSHGCTGPAVALASFPLNADESVQGSLLEIKERRRALLIVVRSSVIVVGNASAAIIDDALKPGPRDSRRHYYPYNVIAGKLNKYMRKHRSMSAVERVEQADYIIYFNLVEYRRTINGVYPYGELYVILNRGAGDAKPARIIWKTTKPMWAEDAVKEFLSELKRVRGER